MCCVCAQVVTSLRVNYIMFSFNCKCAVKWQSSPPPVVSCHVEPYCLQLDEPPILLWKYLPTFLTMFSVPHNYEHRVPSDHEHRDAIVLKNWRMKLFWFQISHLYGRDGQNSSVVTGHWPKKLVKRLREKVLAQRPGIRQGVIFSLLHTITFFWK